MSALLDSLLRSGRQITVLLEAESSAGPVYVSNTGFVSSSNDAENPNRAYPDWLIGVPEIKQALPSGLFGRSTIGWSDALLSNPKGVRDGWLYLAWDGRPARVLVGAQDWALADFEPVFAGFVTSLQADSSGNLRLAMSDERERANRPVQPVISSRPISFGPPLEPANPTDPIAPPPGVEIPLCFGTCFNVEPVLVDASTHTYQVHESAVLGIDDVRVGGLSSAYTSIGGGKFRLDVFPAARVTCDVRGQVSLGANPRADQLIVEIATRLGYSAFDSAALAALAVDAPLGLGIYLSARDNGIDMLDRIASSVGGWWGTNSLGEITAAVSRIGPPAITLTGDDIGEFGIKLDTVTLPSWRRRVGWRRNYTVQSDGLFAAVTEPARDRLGREWDIAAAEYAGTKSLHPLATDPDIEQTLIQDGMVARSEAARRLALFGITGRAFSVNATSRAWSVRIGQTVRVVHSRFGLSAGRDMLVSAISRKPDARSTQLSLFAPGAQSAFSPSLLATELGFALSTESGAEITT